MKLKFAFILSVFCISLTGCSSFSNSDKTEQTVSSTSEYTSSQESEADSKDIQNTTLNDIGSSVASDTESDGITVNPNASYYNNSNDGESDAEDNSYDTYDDDIYSGITPDDILAFPGEYIRKSDDSTLSITHQEGMLYTIDISLTRLASLDDCVGAIVDENTIYFIATDPSGNDTYGTIELDGDGTTATVTITETSWSYFEVGDTFSFEKE